MSSASQQGGFAIALLLWMIAGMSLMVAAVIHLPPRYRHGRTACQGGQTNFKARCCLFIVEGQGTGSIPAASQAQTLRYKPEQGEPESDKPTLFTKQYQFDQGWVVTGTLRPSSGFVSLNDADRNELMMLFTGLGKVDNKDAMAMIDGVLKYRTDFPGFRCRRNYWR